MPQIIAVSIDQIVPWERNPRVHSPEQIDIVARSIKEYGWSNPIILRKGDRTIIAGHGRYLAAKQLQLETVPCIEMDLSEQQAMELALVDNRTVELSHWDHTLPDLLGELHMAGIVLDDLGWCETEVLQLLNGVAADPAADLASMIDVTQPNEYQRQLIINFRTLDAVADFERIMGVQLDGKQKSLAFPIQPCKDHASKVWQAGDSDES